MARRLDIVSDYLQNHKFWLFDVAPIDGIGLPLFLPIFGFQSISSPEITVNVKEIREANNVFSRKVVTGADVGNITLSRGVHWGDSDFYKWTVASLVGRLDIFGPNLGSVVPLGGIPGPSTRRDLILMQFFPRKIDLGNAGNSVGDVVQTSIVTAALGITLTATAQAGGLGGLATNLISTAGIAAMTGFDAGDANALLSLIPAKAWILTGCIPVRYSAGSGLDATNTAISIQELEIAVEEIDEISLAT